jgi:hypothetical protein
MVGVIALFKGSVKWVDSVDKSNTPAKNNLSRPLLNEATPIEAGRYEG